ncbi:carbohydrate porin [Emticicia oligotrophica]|uniref:carbohydrate porin n=1 Tax=Emticicia oligotrophica TaxID=312279 RepID=UPI00273CC2F4|nr:carbohydrate porin [Emticicia oligotrophica]
MNARLFLCYFLIVPITTFAQKQITFHFQQTVVSQTKPSISAPYSGNNSLVSNKETQASITATFFTGSKLWKGAEGYFDAELSGGSGLSGAKGIAGFTNGEAFRIGDSAPKIYLARFYLKQTIPLSKEYILVADGINQVATKYPTKYLRFVVGKFCLSDFFDNNSYSHDPRTQFLNWALMSNGAWDYAANVRGYTTGYMIEYGSPQLGVRFSTTAVPTTANGPDLNYNFAKNYSHSFEINKSIGQKTIIRALAYYTKTYMGNYTEAAQSTDKNILNTRKDGRTKVGFGLNAEQQLSPNSGLFFRTSWNDGRNETWAFTEIDQSISLGFSNNGTKWKRPNDTFGVALVANGISKQHRNYLSEGGYGFMVGDGKLNYGLEKIFETYYNIHLHDKHFWLAPNYQFVVNPAYNKDRGPVNVFSLRAHAEF